MWNAEYNTYGNGSNINLTYKYDEDGTWKKYYNINDHLGNVRAVLRKEINPPATIVKQFDYAPFGKVLYSSYVNRTKFIGKEKDKESNYADHGVRKYDDEIGRFTSIDPLWEKYYSLTPYQYAGNNPVSLFDKTGLAPGDLFNTIEEAIIDFATIYNPPSILDESEYGTRLYKVTFGSGKNKITKYYYVQPLKGNGGYAPIPNAEKGKNSVATLHTHRNWIELVANWTNRFGDKDMNDHLSEGDFYNTRPDRSNLPVYGVFTNGQVELYNPFPPFNTKVYKNIIDDSILLTCDKNLPHRGKNDNTVNSINKQIDLLIKQELKPIYDTIEK